jgi:hypothetical protein
MRTSRWTTVMMLESARGIEKDGGRDLEESLPWEMTKCSVEYVNVRWRRVVG